MFISIKNTNDDQNSSWSSSDNEFTESYLGQNENISGIVNLHGHNFTNFGSVVGDVQINDQSQNLFLTFPIILNGSNGNIISKVNWKKIIGVSSIFIGTGVSLIALEDIILKGLGVIFILSGSGYVIYYLYMDKN